MHAGGREDGRERERAHQQRERRQQEPRRERRETGVPGAHEEPHGGVYHIRELPQEVLECSDSSPSCSFCWSLPRPARWWSSRTQARPAPGPPEPDPGWANIGRRSGYPAIYLGNGWVITARHVGVGDVVLGGVTHHALPESAIRLGKGDGPPTADLVVFRIEPSPDLPALPIRPTPPEVGDRALLIGAGCNRGERTSWNGKTGWTWGPISTLRWGTNRVALVGIDVRAGDNVTPGFAVRFDPNGTRFEAQAAVGDSGGAVFIPAQRPLRARRHPDRNRRLPRAAAQHRDVRKLQHGGGSLGLRPLARCAGASALTSCRLAAHARP